MLQADTANERLSFCRSPGAQFVELVVVDQEVGRAAGTDDRLLTITARFAPLQHIAERVALTVAQVTNDLADVGTQGLLVTYPGSDLSMVCLPTGALNTRAATAARVNAIKPGIIISLTMTCVNPTHYYLAEYHVWLHTLRFAADATSDDTAIKDVDRKQEDISDGR